MARTAGQILLTLAVVTRLSPELNGLWFNFVSLGAMVQFLDLGLSATVLRSASHLQSGVKELRPHGISPDKIEGPNVKELRTLMATTKFIYLVLGAAVVLGAAGLAFTFFKPMTNEVTRLSWLLYALGTAVQLVIGQRYNFLQGVGRLVEAQQLQVLGLLLSCGGAAAVLFLSGSFLAMCGAFAVGSLFQLATYTIKLRNYSGGRPTGALWKAAWPNSWRAGLSRLGIAAIYQLPTLVISSVMGVVVGGRYGFTVQVCLLLTALAQLPLAAIYPRINELSAHGDLSELKRLFFKKLRQTLILYILLGILLVLFGPTLLSLIRSRTSLLSPSLLTALVLFLFREPPEQPRRRCGSIQPISLLEVRRPERNRRGPWKRLGAALGRPIGAYPVAVDGPALLELLVAS